MHLDICSYIYSTLCIQLYIWLNVYTDVYICIHKHTSTPKVHTNITVHILYMSRCIIHVNFALMLV